MIDECDEYTRKYLESAGGDCGKQLTDLVPIAN